MIDRASDATILVGRQPAELNLRLAEAGAGVAFTFAEAVECVRLPRKRPWSMGRPSPEAQCDDLRRTR